MNLGISTGYLRKVWFRVSRAIQHLVPAKCIQAFGNGERQIGAILVINLDRQPSRWRRTLRELGRFKTTERVPLSDVTHRLTAIDARDGRETAATADVDMIYTMGDQLFVQPDARLQECFGLEEPIRMTRQEVAVARSHIEAWKKVARGNDPYVLVLEDDIWFGRGAAAIIDNGWCAATDTGRQSNSPDLVYLSYKDAGGTAEKANIEKFIFKPVRGFWYMSGYVISRQGALKLLKAMPVVGPVDLWVNKQFAHLDVLALTSSAIQQRDDAASDNAYSILPYLARAGVVDAGPAPMPSQTKRKGHVFAWNIPGDQDALGMALSMLGLRVCCFGEEDEPLNRGAMITAMQVFDAFVDLPPDPRAISVVNTAPDARLIVVGDIGRQLPNLEKLPPSRTLTLEDDSTFARWEMLCSFLGLNIPDIAFPGKFQKTQKLFHDDRAQTYPTIPAALKFDESPWILPPTEQWGPRALEQDIVRGSEDVLVLAAMNEPTPTFFALTETFPGNLAVFKHDGLNYGAQGAQLTLRPTQAGVRPYQSGAFASKTAFGYGRFEVEIKAAPGSGLVTGFFLHRDLPRQEIDIELMGSNPHQMLVNVYFNPGDDGAAISYGYRGSPLKIDLGFDATQNFHLYAIEWTPESIRWYVDGRVVHERRSWDPTPIPHLPMRLHGNLWAPRSLELAGRLENTVLPSSAYFRNVIVSTAA